MTRYDQKTLFTSLAFATVLIRDTNLSQRDNEARVLRLAGLFEDFCIKHVQLVPLSEVPLTEKLDQQIEKHTKQLRDKECTVLSTNKQDLLHLYQRLQFRKIYRKNIGLLKDLSSAELADWVLALLDEEIIQAGES